MIVISLDANTELAIYKDKEVKAAKGKAIGLLLELLK